MCVRVHACADVWNTQINLWGITTLESMAPIYFLRTSRFLDRVNFVYQILLSNIVNSILYVFLLKKFILHEEKTCVGWDKQLFFQQWWRPYCLENIEQVVDLSPTLSHELHVQSSLHDMRWHIIEYCLSPSSMLPLLNYITRCYGSKDVVRKVKPPILF